MHVFDTQTAPILDGDVTVKMLEFLAQRELVVAPHVAFTLWGALAADTEAVGEIARVLTPAQRAGHSALPDPLPLTPAVQRAVGAEGLALTADERSLLLAAAVCVDDRTELLLGSGVASMAEIIESRVGQHLLFVAGHFSFADLRMRVWVHGNATLAERTAAHQGLDRAYTALGEARMAIWHRSLATLEGDASLVPGLIELATAAELRGESVWAHSVAREAASHAAGDGAEPAQLRAGISALNSGHIVDAVGWLERALSSHNPVVAARALSPFVHAETLHQGDVPEAALRRHTARLLAAEGTVTPAEFALIVRQLSKAAALAACLHAAQGSADDAARHLAHSEQLAAAHQLDGTDLCAARGWCEVFGITAAPGGVRAECACGRCATDGSEHSVDKLEFSDARAVVRALTLGLEDEAYAGLRLLHTVQGAQPMLIDRNDGEPVRRGSSPLSQAYSAVATALLHFWSGDLARASRELARAASVAPVGLPLSGLGVIVARRLDVAINGRVTSLARALGATYPPNGSAAIRTADLIDRSLAAYLDGHYAEAATLSNLAAERTRRGESAALYVPGFDELSSWSPCVEQFGADKYGSDQLDGLFADAATRVPAGHRLACVARRALSTSDSEQFPIDYAFAVEVSASLRSVYERARTEFVLGRVCAMYGDPAVARQHLVVAAGLFREAGSCAWLRAVETVLSPSRAIASETLTADTVPIMVVGRGAATRGAEESPTVEQLAALQLAAEQQFARAQGAAVSMSAHAVAPLHPFTQFENAAPPHADHRVVGLAPATLAAQTHSAASSDANPLELCRLEWSTVLTERELEVALLVVEGAPNREAASQLHVSVRTVEVHLGRVFAKLGVRSRVELSVLAHRMGSDWRRIAT